MKILLFIFFLVSVMKVSGKGIIVNEIMANPRGSQFAESEYIELFNNGRTVRDLSQITLSINNKNIQLPSYLLAPHQFVILCSKEGEVALNNYGNVVVLSGWATLNNNGATISLKQNGQTIDEVVYKDSWHQSSAKKAGGWSLERINPSWECNLAANWSSTTAVRGGTPGSPNSVYSSSYIPDISITGGDLRTNTIHIRFNIDKMHLPPFTKEQFRINHTENIPAVISWNEHQDTLILLFNEALEMNKLYTLTVQDIEVCGFSISIPSCLIFQQQPVKFNDIVINEILFNPRDGGADFVELYNRTTHAINLQGWKLGNRILSNQLLLISAGDFIVLTTEKEKLLATHPNAIADRIHQIPSLPSYPNRQGIVTLFSPGNLIDSLYYHADMHSSWISNPKGVSLERVSYNDDTNLPANFKSAATLVGGATPGYQNSLIVDNFLMKNNFYLSSKTVSPDGDGFEDQLEINYKLKASNYMLTLHIYDEKGLLIKRLIRNQSAASEAKITWDCTDDNNLKARAGHYIYWVEIYDASGYREVFREAFVLVHKSQDY